MQVKRKSGAQRRKDRVAQGLPAYYEGERASLKRRAYRAVVRRSAANVEFITQLKLELGCTDCGYKDHPAALDFDHLPGFEKVRGISRMLAASRGQLLQELAKCEVVCSNCHRIRTWARRREPPAEGVASAPKPQQLTLL